jgi:hypothetical protein
MQCFRIGALVDCPLPPTATGAQEGLQRGSGGHSVVVVGHDDDDDKVTTWSTGRPCAAAHAVVVVGPYSTHKA